MSCARRNTYRNNLKEKKMKRSKVILTAGLMLCLVIALAGCSTSRKQFAGTFRLTQMETSDGQTYDADQIAEMSDADSAGKIVLKENGTYKMTVVGERGQGRWSIGSKDGEVIFDRGKKYQKKAEFNKKKTSFTINKDGTVFTFEKKK
jgi:hypothetical protein